MSRTLSGLFLVGAVSRPRTQKEEKDKSGESPDNPRANRENPGKIQPNGPAEVQREFFGPMSGLNFGR